jgi:hypothetical protein
MPLVRRAELVEVAVVTTTKTGDVVGDNDDGRWDSDGVVTVL